VTRLLLVGAGKIATAAHLPALRILQAEGLVDVIVWDVDPRKVEALRPEFEVTTTSNWVDAAPTVDAVAICVPPGPNAEIAIEAASRGLHVLCEKPPGRSVEQARQMAASVQDDRVTMVGFNRRSSTIYRTAMARSLELGPPTTFIARMSRAAMGRAPSDTATDWIMSDSSHALDLAVATIGFPNAVSISRRSVGSSIDNVWTVQLHAEGGSAVLVFHYAAASRAERYEWIGPGYDVAMEFPTDLTWTEVGSNPESTTIERPESGTTEYADSFGFIDEYRLFLGAISGDVPPPRWDFAYGADFMNLVRVVLATPSGRLQTIERSDLAIESGIAGAARSERTTPPKAPRERPSILLLHSHEAQRRFFTLEELGRLGEHGDVATWSDDDAGFRALENAQVVVAGRGAPPLPRDLVDRAHQLRLLVVLGASVQSFSPEALLRRGVIVANTADAVAVGVAEHCLMVTLAGLRRLTEIDSGMHRGEWPRPGQGGARNKSRLKRLVPVSVKRKLLAMRGGAATTLGGSGAAPIGVASDLRGQRVGLIGWGYTARRFAELLEPFGCELLVFSESADPTDFSAVGARPSSISEVLRSTKIISLHRGLNDATRNFLDRSRLAQIQSGSVLVNTARGGLIDEEALIKRLGRGDIVAALDVFGEEPLPKGHPLRRLSNVILTPHNASTTVQEAPRMGEQAVGLILDWIDGHEVATIDTDRLARMT
jgi:phosphoglycerate dehydrogenase-like enzyme/predicted dehydrogenase